MNETLTARAWEIEHSPQDAFEHCRMENKHPFILHFDVASICKHIPLLKLAKRKNAVRMLHVFNDEISKKHIAGRHNPYASLVSEEHPDENKKWKTIKQYASLFSCCIVSDYMVANALKKYFQRIYVLPEMIHFRNLSPVYTCTSEEPVIAYAKRDKESEQVVQRIFKQLAEAGFDFETKAIVPHKYEDRIDDLCQANIIMDYDLHGSLNYFTKVCMALGKPVVTHISKDIYTRLPAEIPLHHCSPPKLYEKLQHLISHYNEWIDAGHENRKYVKTYHEPQQTCSHLKWIYRREYQIMNGNEVGFPSVVDCQDYVPKQFRMDLKTRYITTNHEVITKTYEINETPSAPSLLRYKPALQCFRKENEGICFKFSMDQMEEQDQIKQAKLIVPFQKDMEQFELYIMKEDWDEKEMEQTSFTQKQMELAFCVDLTNKYKETKSTLEWECTPLVRQWLENQQQNFGFFLKNNMKLTPEIVLETSNNESTRMF